jgi:hypothetical protein
LVLSFSGLLLALGSFTLDRVRAAKGLPVAGHTAGIPTRPIEVG